MMATLKSITTVYSRRGQDIARLVNVERQAGRKREKCGRSNAEHHGKKAGTQSTDQRCDYDRRKERSKLKAMNIRIDGQPQRRGEPNGHESEQVGPNGSRPQRGNIDVKLS
jgi:hypothetical protein